jgi:tripartite-type tricarboxylate transporter receptor subunit TctC
MRKFLAVLLIAAVTFSVAFAEDWPTKSINMTVPYNAGGTTDLTGRALANGMSKVLGVTLNVINTPGAGGSAGSLNVQNARLDGYSMLANGMLAFCTMPVNGYTEKTFREWDIWLATFAPNAFIVPKDSPYNTIQDLIEAMRANPGKITAGTAGIGTGGHFGAEVLKAVAGADYKHITYPGGAAAVTATLSGEVDFCPQLLAEYKDLILAGEVKVLACLAEDDIVLSPAVTIPTIAKAYPEAKKFLPMGEVTGILVPKGLSEDILKKIDEAFDFAVKQKDFLDFAEVRSFVVNPMGRKASQEFLEKFAAQASYILFDAGATTIDPAKFGLKR